MIDDRKDCTLSAAMNSVMCEKQVWRRRTGHPESATLEQKFFATCLNSFKHIAVQKYKGDGEEEVPRAASCASASLQRIKGFPLASKDRSERAQEDGKNREDGHESNRGHWRRK